MKWLHRAFPAAATAKKKSSICEWCSTEFYRPSKAIRFCGVDCAAKWRGAQRRRLTAKECEHCHELYDPPRSSSRFCSPTCRALWVNSVRTAESRRRGAETARGRFARERGGLTKAEFVLWQALGGDAAGWYPQFWMSPLGEVPDVVYFRIDIASPTRKIAVEADGSSHRFPSGSLHRDPLRDEWLRAQKWTVLRFWNEEILGSTDSVVEQITSSFTT